MEENLTAVACNLRNLLWRTEELKATVEKEVKKNKRENIYEIQGSVNNLMAVLRLADENLKELEGLVSPLFSECNKKINKSG